MTVIALILLVLGILSFVAGMIIPGIVLVIFSVWIFTKL